MEPWRRAVDDKLVEGFDHTVAGDLDGAIGPGVVSETDEVLAKLGAFGSFPEAKGPSRVEV